MEYQELRKKLKHLKKYPGCKLIPRCPLVNPGFPGTFNISFGEDPILKEFGKYQFFDHDAVFSTIQKVIRHNDILSGLKENPERYLGIFEMSDVFGLILLKQKANFKELSKKQAESVINLLTSLGIKKEDIFPKYCGGGKIEKLTDGKYKFDKEIPEDIFTLKALLDLGIPKENMRKDYTRDTLLALNLVSGNIAWGYRTEIEVKTGKNEFLDVATIELFMWDPVFNSKNEIIDLQDITYTLALTVTGVERLFMVANSIKDVREIPHIKRLYDRFEKKSIEVEYLRTLHAIYSDKKKYKFETGKHRRVIINRMIREVKMPEQKMRELLELNSNLQPWFPELKDGVKLTIKAILKYRKS